MAKTEDVITTALRLATLKAKSPRADVTQVGDVIYIAGRVRKPLCSGLAIEQVDVKERCSRCHLEGQPRCKIVKASQPWVPPSPPMVAATSSGGPGFVRLGRDGQPLVKEPPPTREFTDQGERVIPDSNDELETLLEGNEDLDREAKNRILRRLR